MADLEMFFNWRGSGASHCPPIATEWVMDLLRNTLELDEEMLQDMGGAIRSEIFCAALLVMQALRIVEMPDWLPSQYRNPRHNWPDCAAWRWPWLQLWVQILKPQSEPAVLPMDSQPV